MALIIRSPATTFAIKKFHYPPLPPHNLRSNPKSKDFKIKFQDSSSSTSQPTEPTESSSTSSSPTVAPPPPKKQPNSAGLAFGSASTAKIPPVPAASKKKQKRKKERASIIRRVPVDKPSFAAQKNEVKDKEQSQNKSAFLLAWLGLGAIILVEGLILAASGFLPEELDNVFVKYLYPTFTPTVGLFIAGTVGYGVLKYLQNEKQTNAN